MTVVAEKMENVANLTRLPCFSIASFRSFMEDEKVWGKTADSVYMDDVLIHVRDGGVITSYTNDEATRDSLPNALPFDDEMLTSHSDSATVYVECGYVLASDEASITRYVRNTADNPKFLFGGRRHSSAIADIIQARELNSPKELVI